MSLEKLQLTLEETFSANFVAYYRSHVAHVNTIGRNFSADHKLLEGIYEYFQDNIDTIGEKLRTVRAKMPSSIETVLAISPLQDSETDGDADELLETVLASVNMMVDQYHELYEAAEEANYIDISNFAQDQVGILVKHRWMLESTLDEQ